MKHPFIIAAALGVVLNVTPKIELAAAPKEATKESKDYLAVTEDTSNKVAPVDTHSEFTPLHPAEKLHSESPILRESVELQDAPATLNRDAVAINPDSETDLALKPRKSKSSH